MPELPDCIFGRWAHSYEEDHDGRLVFRPTDYPLPPTRGRDGVEFHSNGEFVRYGISPRDGLAAVPSRWTVTDAGHVRVGAEGTSDCWAIIECSEQRLVLEPRAL